MIIDDTAAADTNADHQAQTDADSGRDVVADPPVRQRTRRTGHLQLVGSGEEQGGEEGEESVSGFQHREYLLVGVRSKVRIMHDLRGASSMCLFGIDKAFVRACLKKCFFIKKH